jgi:methionyl-tRNA formyltransferase
MTRGRIAFIGAVHEAAPALEVLLRRDEADVVTVITCTEKAAARMSGVVDLAHLARSAGVQVLYVDDISAAPVVQQLDDLDLDLSVVVGWTRLLSAAVLRLPRAGCVGFHASLLPRHRGRAPVNWAILRGEQVTGNTMMYLDVHADTGDIIDQRSVPITPTDTCGTVYAGVARAGAEMLAEHLPALLDGTAPRRPQDRTAGDLLPKRTPDMGVIDWEQGPRVVHDWVRALTLPYPGAFGCAGGRKVSIWSTALPGEGEPAGAPGRVMSVTGSSVRVGTRGGSIVVISASLDGAPPRPAAQVFAESGLAVGSQFDDVPIEARRWARGEALV